MQKRFEEKKSCGNNEYTFLKDVFALHQLISFFLTEKNKISEIFPIFLFIKRTVLLIFAKTSFPTNFLMFRNLFHSLNINPKVFVRNIQKITNLEPTFLRHHPLVWTKKNLRERNFFFNFASEKFLNVSTERIFLCF